MESRVTILNRARLTSITATLLDRIDSISSMYGLSSRHLMEMWLTARVVQYTQEADNMEFPMNDEMIEDIDDRK
jgi:hypothetical protein